MEISKAPTLRLREIIFIMEISKALIVIIKIMDIFKAPTRRPKELNKYKTHKIHRDRDCCQFAKQLTDNGYINSG